MWLVLSMMMAAASLCLLSWWLGGPFARVGRAHHVPGPLLPSLLWPWVEAMAPLCNRAMSWHLRRRLEQLLSRSGVTHFGTPQHFLAWQCLLAMMAAGFMAAAGFGSFDVSTLVVLACISAMLAAFWPWQRLRERIRRRNAMMLRDFPFLLDLVTLCVEAGLSLHGALTQAADKGPEGPLREELRHLLADIRAGSPRPDALLRWAGRCDIPPVHQFVAAVAQADASGMSLGQVLRAQAAQGRKERFLRAEKLALEAPVKMMFPLIFCIFPCSFLIIAWPIAAQFLALLNEQ